MLDLLVADEILAMAVISLWVRTVYSVLEEMNTQQGLLEFGQYSELCKRQGENHFNS